MSAEDADNLRGRGLQPGDAEWEQRGICRTVTWPRSRFTTLGKRDDGTPLPGTYLTGKTEEKEKQRRFVQIGFVDPVSLDTGKKKQLLAAIDRLPQTLVKELCRFIVSEDHKVSILFDESAADDWLTALEEQVQITDIYIVTPIKRVFEELKTKANEALGPLLVSEEAKRPMSDGFAANLAYFKLDFLEKDRVALKRAFREILPLLWLKAGAIGPRPKLAKTAAEPKFFAPKENSFAVLLDESRLSEFVDVIKVRTDLTHIFLVTDDDEAFKEMAAEVADKIKTSHRVQVVQLYRDYLENFMINKGVDDRAKTSGGEA
ncbi:MAG: hypothetical protein ACJ8LN_12040 [Sulfurifustis sp.]